MCCVSLFAVLYYVMQPRVTYIKARRLSFTFRLINAKSELSTPEWDDVFRTPNRRHSFSFIIDTIPSPIRPDLSLKTAALDRFNEVGKGVWVTLLFDVDARYKSHNTNFHIETTSHSSRMIALSETTSHSSSTSTSARHSPPSANTECTESSNNPNCRSYSNCS